MGRSLRSHTIPALRSCSSSRMDFPPSASYYSSTTSAVGFVDDTSILTSGRRTFEKADEISVDWAKTPGAAFTPDECHLIHFTSKLKKFNMQATSESLFSNANHPCTIHRCHEKVRTLGRLSPFSSSVYCCCCCCFAVLVVAVVFLLVVDEQTMNIRQRRSKWRHLSLQGLALAWADLVLSRATPKTWSSPTERRLCTRGLCSRCQARWHSNDHLSVR